MRLYGIIGHPLTQSFSERYFNEKFSREGLTGFSYRKFPLPSVDDLPGLLASEPELCGFNVTIPYKVEVMRFLHSLDPGAEAVGAVNVVKIIRRGGVVELRGYNTDSPAFRQTVETHVGATAKKALVLGTGGASAAVVYALRSLGMSVRRVSRTPGEGKMTYSDLTPSVMAETDLIVNTTPAGMFPDVDNFPPVDYDLLDSRHFLYDLIYNPEKTVFLKRGEEHGCRIINGMEMLYLQAELAWEIWQS